MFKFITQNDIFKYNSYLTFQKKFKAHPTQFEI